jgi:hypothetical protein
MMEKRGNWNWEGGEEVGRRRGNENTSRWRGKARGRERGTGEDEEVAH